MKYPRKAPLTIRQDTNGNKTPKKYHVGYIAGVFDLFHIGHLNMFKRAKEQCDYLIVGVVNDESVMKNKKTMPYIPFEERIELVRACRYVDEAVEIPTDYNNTDEAYRRYQFDVQFSGSDYADNPVWLAKKVFLQKQGSDMVFFPYTQSTSSTKIKELIEKNLL
ncbi:MAG: adenylyltransferase/cytidyltransferase family protein [Lachnospiraceae bacterium]|nr:adenylyltransferase/cytidyltransferase family protein [Lachnospiraceae bacterium]